MTAHTALHASQAGAHANKADDASPFSALLQSVAPKADKTKLKDKSASDDPDDAKNTKTDTLKADSKTDAKADATAKSAQADKSDPADKTDKTDDTAKADATDATQVAADTPTAPPVPVVVANAPTPGEANSDIEAVAGANAAAPQIDKTGKTDQADKAAPQDADQAADAAAPQDIKGGAKPAAHKAPQELADAKSGKADDVKADGVKADNTKADNAKPEAPQAADASTAKPAQPASTNMAVHDITAPQAPQAAQANAPATTQHVQVAAPTPNMPALAIEISAKSQSGAKQFDIRLDPPELGRVEVRLSIDAAGKASAHLSADNPQTLDLLQKDSSSLTRALRDAGLDVSQDGLNFSLRQQSQNSQDGSAHQGGSRGASRGLALSATTSIEATATSAAYRRPADGRVDISV